MKQKIMTAPSLQDKEKRFTLLLIVLLALFLVQPVFSGNQKILTLLSDLVFSILIGTTTYALSTRRQYMIFALLLGLPAIILRWLYWIYLEQYLWVASYLLGISILLFCNFELFSFILQVKKVSQHTVNAAICIYLLLGVAWGMAYIVLETLAPGSFTLAELVNKPQALIMEMQYYSIVTLTTLGYGDITPVTPWAKNLSALEAVIGQVYLTVLVARLVSLNAAQVNQNK